VLNDGGDCGCGGAELRGREEGAREGLYPIPPHLFHLW
jgi:hypothetical protein